MYSFVVENLSIADLVESQLYNKLAIIKCLKFAYSKQILKKYKQSMKKIFYKNLAL